MNYILNPFKQIFDINGRASLKEFWIFLLFYFFIIIPLLAFFKHSFDLERQFILIFRILMVAPFISLGFRRMNDANLSKWLFLIPLVNLILAGFPSKKSVPE